MQATNFTPTLYYYEHCPYCIRVLTMLGLAKINVKKVVLLNDDEATSNKMIGAKMVPILEISPNQYMPESMDIVEYLSREFNVELLVDAGLQSQVEAFLDDQRMNIYSLTMPRCVKLPLAEFKTQAAIDYFVNKKTAFIGDFDTALANSSQYIDVLETALQNLSELFTQLSKQTNSVAAIMLFSALYGVTDVKDFIWPEAAKAFIQSMGKASQQPVFDKPYQPI